MKLGMKLELGVDRDLCCCCQLEDERGLVRVSNLEICRRCIADAVTNLLAADERKILDQTLLEILVKYGHGEMPDEITLAAFLDHVWRTHNVKEPSQPEVTPVKPGVTAVSSLTWAERIDLIRLSHAQQGIGGHDLEHAIPHSRCSDGERVAQAFCRERRVIVLENNSVAAARFSTFEERDSLLKDVEQIFQFRPMVIIANQRQIDEMIALYCTP